MVGMGILIVMKTILAKSTEMDSPLYAWLQSGDVSIRFQTQRDLLGEYRSDLQERIASEGWGAQLLAARQPDGHWGDRFYQPKWTSSHYTLLDLRNLCVIPDHPLIQESIAKIAREEKSPDGGVNPAQSIAQSDVCVNGMFLNYAAYFQTDETYLRSVIDFLLKEQMADGGWNCRSNRSGAVHSSLHSTISTLEGITEYLENGYTYRRKELEIAVAKGVEFILLHRVFLSDRTGKVIHPAFLKMPYPCRWKYDFLRALDYFQRAAIQWDERLQPALDLLLEKRNQDGTWNLNAKHPGQVHIEMEKAGKPSRWNTLRAIRVLKHFEVN
jgi:hypothetical protein